MNDKARAKEKIRIYSECIRQLEAEKAALQKYIDDKRFNALFEAKAQQRIFDLKVTIEGHQAFINEYQARINPTTYRKSL
jgi:hypothetical protein